MIFDLFLDKGNKKGGKNNASNGATTAAPAATGAPQAPPSRMFRQQRSQNLSSGKDMFNTNSTESK